MITLQFILIFSLIGMQPNRYGNYEFPAWSNGVGWSLSLFSVSAIPIMMIMQISREKGPILERVKRLMRPASDWGPMLQSHRIEACYSPKHIDSQVPLAGNFDEDGDDYNFEESSLSSSSDEDRRRKGAASFGYSKRDFCLRNDSFLNDEPTDSEAGLRLNLPSPDPSPTRLLKPNSGRTNETHF
jgi:hypothetical protein